MQTKLIELIDCKIKEHDFEVNGCAQELNRLKNEGKFSKKLPDTQELKTLIGLKEKMNFHRTSILILEDLKRDITNAQSD